MELFVNRQAVAFEDGDDILTALARTGRVPAGCLCMAGDCPNCLATVDGVAYVRMCQTQATEGMSVEPFPVSLYPEMPPGSQRDEVARRIRHVDSVVVGGGSSGRAEADRLRREGLVVEMLDVAFGSEALAVYPGPEVVARCGQEIVRYFADEIVVATGAAHVQPVVPGAHLTGILTRPAASRLASAGVDLGRVVAVGPPPDDVECESVTGTLVRFDGRQRVHAVVVEDSAGVRTRRECDTVTVDLGTYPRDVLARMGVPGEVRAIGGAASSPTIPPCPDEGVICPCSEVTVGDLDFVWDRGFHELELIKRATLAGTGSCQGGVCAPYLRSFVAERGGSLQPSFTARPLARQMTMGEAAAGVHLPSIHRTGLDSVHRSLGARMDRVGGWWRPWTYGDPDGEYHAVRERVSLGDVGTLGKMLVRGPDAVEFLEYLYPCRVGDLAAGRSRYALLLAESGGLLDDGLISRLDDSTFALTFTSGGASFAEAWVRDWARGSQADVRIMDRTHSLGAINVTGPHASELLDRAGLSEALRFMRHTEAVIAGVPCRIFRLSFTGEVSYELHHPYPRSEELWSELMRLGADLGVRPHGLLTLQTLRLEKGHVIVGMDTEPDSTPRRLDMEWAVRMEKGDFVGRQALERTGRLPLDRRLVGLTMDPPVPVDGSPIGHPDGFQAGYVTSAAWSHVLDTVVMLGWVDLIGGEVPDTVVIDGRVASHAPHPFYDPEGARARA
ncbi:MAG TPA: glycine cleavage T C-terminal barrel domain-containing protein [Acidimicrobiia bacterium]|nr:glycine cleavage T C-terminal barrel domain-containing protein [Acidimicrobiia bacterium]